MIERLHQLSKRANLLRLEAGDPLDFGDVVAMLILLIGLAPFVSAGLWASP
jgi:hypothetical protein